MKKLLAWLVLLCTLASATAHAISPPFGDRYVRDAATAVYASPDANAEVSCTLAAGEPFYIDRMQDGWLLIAAFGSGYFHTVLGWIAEEGVRPAPPEASRYDAQTAASPRQTGLARVRGESVALREGPVDGKVITRFGSGVGVYVFDQMEADDGYTWYHVNAMHRSRNTKGWIRGDLLALPDTLFCDIVDVAVGNAHVIALKADGTVIAGGTGHCGCCDVVGLQGVVDVIAGMHTSFVFFEDGSFWGEGLAYSAGNNAGSERLADVAFLGNTWVGIDADGAFVHSQWLHGVDEHGNQVRIYDATDLEGIVQIATGENLMVCLTADGRAHMYGEGKAYHAQVESWENLTQVAAFGHVVGLRADGTVVAAGDNAHGECDVSGWTDIIDIAASEDYTLGLRADGTVVAAGSNLFGACAIEGYTDIVQVEAGQNFSVCLTAQGTLRFAGDFRFLDKTDAQGYVYRTSGE